MPYKPFKVRGGFKVRKVNENGKPASGFLSKKPLTREAAMAQMRALYAAENKKEDGEAYTTTVSGVVLGEIEEAIEQAESGDDITVEAKEYDEKDWDMMEEPGMPMMGGPVSFEELMASEMAQESIEQARDLTNKFTDMANRILVRPDVADKGDALSGLAKSYVDLVQGAMALVKGAKDALGFKGDEELAKEEFMSRPFHDIIIDYYELVDKGIIEP